MQRPKEAKEAKERAEKEQVEQERLAREAEEERLSEKAKKKAAEQTLDGRGNPEEGEILEDEDTCFIFRMTETRLEKASTSIRLLLQSDDASNGFGSYRQHWWSDCHTETHRSKRGEKRDPNRLGNTQNQARKTNK